MLGNNVGSRAVGEQVVGLNIVIEVRLQCVQLVTLLKGGESTAHRFNFSLIMGIGSCTNMNLVVGAEHGDVALIDILKVFFIVDGTLGGLVGIDERLGGNETFDAQVLNLGQIAFAQLFKFFLGAKFKLGHLDATATVGSRNDHLEVLILFVNSLAEAEGDGVEVGCRQTVLTHAFAAVKQYPSVGIDGGVGILFEVTAIDLPVTPVTSGIALGVVTGDKLVEQGLLGLHGVEDDPRTTLLDIAAPLGGVILINELEVVLVLAPGIHVARKDAEATLKSSPNHIVEVGDIGQHLCILNLEVGDDVVIRAVGIVVVRFNIVVEEGFPVFPSFRIHIAHSIVHLVKGKVKVLVPLY